MPSELLPWLTSLTAGMVSFLAAADAHIVIGIVLLTYLAQSTLRKRLRSRGTFEVNLIAKQYGGGGHKSAAGFISEKPLLLPDNAQSQG